MRFNMRGFGLIIILTFQFFALTAQTLSGPNPTYAGSTQTYTSSGWANSPSWQVSNGTKVSSNNNSITITWSTTATSGGVVLTDVSTGTFMGSLSVNLIPAPPTPSAASSITSTSFTASWGSLANATGYKIDVSTVNTFASFVSGYNNLAVSTTTQSVTGLSSGVTYYYRVRAINASGVSLNSATITVPTIPAAPVANAATSVASTSFTANWSSVIGATAYRLDVSTVNTFASFVSGYSDLSVATLSQSVTGLASGTIYYYRVRAVNASGASPSSANASTTTLPGVPAVPVPAAATAVTSSSFIANWASVAGATSYQLDVSTVTTFASFVSGYNSLAVTTLNQNVTGLANGTTYYYRLRAVSTGGVSGSSSYITISTLPLAPVATASSNITSNSFTANWNSVVGATGYLLDVSTFSDFSSFVSGYNNLSVTATNKVVTNLALKTTYYYRVRASNAGGASANSNIITAVDLDYNYIKTVSVLKKSVTNQSELDGAISTGTSAAVAYTFFDGLGRPIQSVSMKASPNQNDIVQPIAYDQFGRQAVKYLPYISGNDGWFKPDFIARENANYTTTSSPQYQFYQTAANVAVDTKPFAESRFEVSPLTRVLEQGSPGLAWQPDAIDAYSSNTDRTIKVSYETNIANEVKVWTYTAATATTPIKLMSTTYFPASQLIKTKTKDEQFNEVIEFKDKMGRTILKKIQAPSGWAETYYIYDDMGNLVVVLPPEGVKALSN